PAPVSATDDTARAARTGEAQGRRVVLALPLDVQAGACTWPGTAPVWPASAVPSPPPADVTALAEALARARRPVFIAGRGARIAEARAALEQLADRCGALLAPSAPPQ